MKKIGIISQVDYNNYGNRFQSYATQSVLLAMGYEVETIDYYVQQNNVFISKIQRLSKLSFNEIVYRIRNRFSNITNKNGKNKTALQIEKESKFKDFSSKHINEFKFTIRNKDDLDYLNSRYDYFLVGSDQVWNPLFFNSTNRTELNFLTFASKYKRIAFSASFGIDYIPKKYTKEFKKWISGIEHISVREESGRRIVKELTGKDSIVLIDPTLMLSKNDWLNISKPIDEFIDGDYIVTYFIGSESESYRDIVNKYARNNDVHLINLADYSNDRYAIDPSEFISYISNAKAVFTNSYHGAIFSIIFEKPFIVFNRTGNSAPMNTRIDTLLTKFKYKERLRENLENIDDIYNMDFSHTYQIIQCEREKVYKYLKDSLQAEDTLDYES